MEISDHETVSQIAMHLYFKTSPHGCSTPTNMVLSPRQTGASVEKEGKCVSIYF